LRLKKRKRVAAEERKERLNADALRLDVEAKRLDADMKKTERELQ